MIRDLLLGARILAKNPLFACLVALTLGLGIGANTAIFSVVHSVLLKPLPFEAPEGLVHFSGNRVQVLSDSVGVSAADFLDLRSQLKSFQKMSLYSIRPTPETLLIGGSAESILSNQVTANFFETLGIAPALGQGFSAQEEIAGNNRAAMLSHRLWLRLFGGTPNVVGRSINLSGTDYRITGVMPASFDFPQGTDLWIPVPFKGFLTSRRNYLGYLGIARLAPGVPLEQAQSELSGSSIALRQQYPIEVKDYRIAAISLTELATGNVRPTLLLLWASVGLLLLIACANIANLLLARASSRQREMAIRNAMGGSRAAIVRQMLAESIVLGLAGGIAGMCLAALSIHLLRVYGAGLVPRLSEVHIDAFVILFDFTLGIVAAMLFGLPPALQCTGGSLHESLKDSSRGSSEGLRGNKLRSTLVIVEVAVSLVLLISAGLMIETLRRLMNVDPGFKPKHAIAMQFPIPGKKFVTPARASAFLDEFLDRVRHSPGVEAAGFATTLPSVNAIMVSEFAAEGESPDSAKKATGVASVTRGYFEAMGIPLIRGRLFNDSDRFESPKVVVISEQLANTYFVGQDPIGRHITMQFAPAFKYEIVGIAGGVRQSGIVEEKRKDVYINLSQNLYIQAFLIVRSSVDPNAIFVALRKELSSIAPDLPLHHLRTMEDVIDNSVAQFRLRGMLLAIFALTALLLASVGIYGVMAFTVSRRKHEIGIRMALGASKGDVMGLVLRQSMTLTGIGLAAGVGVALLCGRVLQGLLFGVSAADPVLFVGLSLLLATVAFAATWFPAVRATKVDPLIALRDQ